MDAEHLVDNKLVMEQELSSEKVTGVLQPTIPEPSLGSSER